MDASATILEATGRDFPFSISVVRDDGDASSNVGRARRRAMDMGLAALGQDYNGVLLTTDADTVLSPDWVTSNLAALRRADLVTGDIQQRPDGFSPHHARVKAYFDRLHALNALLDPVPWQAKRSHHHAGGASMAFAAETYLRLNGFPELPRGEDAALVTTARHQGFRVRRDADVVVQTSTRRTGRVEAGFAAHLLSLDEAGTADHLPVVDPDVAARQYRAHARARAAYRTPGKGRWTALSRALGKTAAELEALLPDCPNAEAFATRVVPAPSAPEPLPLAAAERRLARLIGHRRTGTARVD